RYRHTSYPVRMAGRPAISSLLPYTTLFRSCSPITGTSSSGRSATTSSPEGASPALTSWGAPTTATGDRRARDRPGVHRVADHEPDRKSTRLNSSHEWISYAVFCLKKKTLHH